MSRLAKLAAGRYLYRGSAIVRTDWPGEGPRKGTIYLWELGEVDQDGVITLDGLSGYRTLRAAMEAVDTTPGVEA